MQIVKIRLMFLVVISFLAITVTQTPQASESLDKAKTNPSILIGVWDVNLYFSADQPPSSTVMQIISVEKEILTGNFYGSDFEIARVTYFDNTFIMSFVTSDGSGPYIHSASLNTDGTLTGQTLSTGREFLMGWRATMRK